MTRLYKTKDGYEIVKHSREIYVICGKTVRFIGVAGNGYKSSGFLLRTIPNEIKTIFFQIQKQTK